MEWIKMKRMDGMPIKGMNEEDGWNADERDE